MPGAYRPILFLNMPGNFEHTQFGRRPGRTTEQALLVLSNAINQAWYKHKVVTLIVFDLKGAFNGVIGIKFDDRAASECRPSARLAALAYILTFFNADLVDQSVDSHGGASAFVDDCFRWRVGRSAEEKLAKIQAEDVPRVEEKRGELLEDRITFGGADVTPLHTAKLLGVVFDQGLRWKEHVQQAIKRATKTTIALSGLMTRPQCVIF
ncbi:hypothetical protein N7454_005252 [Penicillium verhagenii]|nr:hypothetical protein N7454_005252 [Penicillium verhagenii]